MRFLLDSNGADARSINDLRFSVVALDTHNGHVVWRHRLEIPSPNDGEYATLQPLFQDGAVYVGYSYFAPQTGIYHAVLEALDPATGHARWRHEAGTELVGEPVAVGSVVYASFSILQTQGQQSTESALVMALDSRTGSPRWTAALSGQPTMPAVMDNQVFVMTHQPFGGGHLFALSASDGSIMWDHTSGVPLSRGGDTENGGSTAPLAVNHLVYAQGTNRTPDGSANLALLALNERDGSVAWHYETGGITASPATNQSGDTLCITQFVPARTGEASSAVGLDAATGHKRWSIAISGIASACVASGDTFYLDDAPMDYKTGTILALSSQDGRQLWRTPVGAPQIADGALPPSVSGDIVAEYVQVPAPSNGPVTSGIVAVRITDGKVLWHLEFTGRPDTLLDIEGSQIYVPEYSEDRPILVAYSLDTGARLWSYTLGNA